LYLGKTGRCPRRQVSGLSLCDERLIADGWRVDAGSAFDAMGVAVERTHAMGIQFHACFRPAGFYFPPPSEHFNRDGFYEQHPELRMVTRNGANGFTHRLLVPATRAYVLTILREIAQYPVDGLPSSSTARPRSWLRAATRRELHRGVRRGSPAAA